MKTNLLYQLLKRIATSKQKVIFVGLAVVSLCMSFSSIAISWIFKTFIDVAVNDVSYSLATVIIVSLIIVISYAITCVISSVLGAKSYNNIEESLRLKLWDNYWYGSYQQTHKYHSASIMSRLTRDIAKLSEGFSSIFGQLLLEIVTVSGAIIVMLIINWKVTIVLLFTIPILTYLIKYFAPKLQNFTQIDSSNEDANRSFMQEMMGHHTLLLSYGMENVLREKLIALYSKKKRSNIQKAKISGVLSFFNSALSFIVLILTMSLGLHYVWQNENSVGDLVALIQLSNYITLPITRISHWVSLFSEMKTAAGRISELEERKQVLLPLKEYEETPEINLLKLDEISFSYSDNGDDSVFERISADFQTGLVSCILGPSGCGKSTLLKIIMGLYTPRNGSVQLLDENENPVSDNVKELSKLTAYIPSDGFIFSGTIAENICMSKMRDDKKIVNSASEANILDYIKGLPYQFETEIAENGKNFSMGQGQRIAIARALYKDAPILLLDEPTANLDHESIEIFHNTIRGLSKNHICIIVTHNKETAEICDVTYSFANGTLERKVKIEND